MRITALHSLDLRFPLPAGAGSDAVHANPIYSLATCVLESDTGLRATGFSLTLGEGNDLVCAAIGHYAKYLVGADVDETIASLGERWRAWANDSQLRWLGPQEGVVHLALASVVGALVDRWARGRQAPLWRALLDLAPEEVVALIDFSTLVDFLSREAAIELLVQRRLSAPQADELIVFKNFLASGALDIAQPDAVRLGGLPEYLAVALMATKSSVPVLAHAGDMGQLHQHLTFFTRIAVGLPELPLEMIPHLAEHFAEPCQIVAGRYRAPSRPGASTTIRDESVRRYAAAWAQ